MKLSIDKDVLLSGIQTVQNVIIAKTSLPILSNILLEAQNEQLRLTATDLDIGITCVVPVEVRETGAITVPAKRFSDIIKELPAGKIQLMAKKNNQMNIEAPPCQFRVMGLAREEFPRLPEFKDKEVINVGQKDLKEMLRVTSFAASTDEHRYILNGVLFRFHKNNLTMVATDGKRLAVVEKKLNTPSNIEASIIVPQKAVQELGRNLKDEGSVSLVLGLNQVLFELGFTSIISRLIEGEFPDYKQVIPSPTDNKLRLNRGEFLLAVKRAALLSTPDYQAVKLEVFKNKLVLSKSTPDVGESREEISIAYVGKELVVGFNPLYLVDVLKNLDVEFIDLELTDTEKPGVIRNDGYTYIVLPMRLG